MGFKEKIDKLLSIKGIKLYKLAEISQFGNTLEKAYADNREMTPRKTKTFIHNLGINKVWWDTGEGEIFLQNGGSNEKENGQDAEDAYRKILEGTEYYVIPRAVLKENYRLVALEQFQKEKEERDQEKIDAKVQADKDRLSLEAHIESSREFARQLAVVITKLADANILIAKLTEMQIRQK